MRRLLLALSCLVAIAPGFAAEPFVFVSLPDTQRYAEDLRPPHPLALDPMGTYRYFVDQTRWIVENAQQEKIRFVVHLGDIVQTADDVRQWERAKAAMDLIHDADIPYGICIGNHDLLRDPRHIYQAALTYFGPGRFAGKPWFRGASPKGTSSYQVIEHGKWKFLFLNLSYGTPKEDVEWAHGVLEENRDKVAIVSTHAYLWDMVASSGRYGENTGVPVPGTDRINISGRVEGSMLSQELYESFVMQHPNIFMVQCGHSGLDWYRTDGVNSAGLPVIEALTDYQILPNGGEGYLRIYSIDPEAGTLTATTYSPTKDRYRTSMEHFVQLVALGMSIDEKVAKRNVDPNLMKRLFLLPMKRDVIPDRDVIAENPEFAKDPDLYRRLFRETFMGPVPPEAGTPEEWESFWMKLFAADPSNPQDYGPNERSPSFVIKIELDRYVEQAAAVK